MIYFGEKLGKCRNVKVLIWKEYEIGKLFNRNPEVEVKVNNYQIARK